MKTQGKFRCYYNRHGAAPLMFCIAPVVGAWEIAIQTVDIKVPSRLVYRAKATDDDDDGKPSAWVECEGELEVFESGYARVGPSARFA